jgi:sterol desaturase/sphingolipid hydroxylase (fatty acid hydroxylase superfamily)
MTAAEPLLQHFPIRIALIAARAAVVVLLLLMIPAALLTLAAAGPTLSDATASYRVGSLVLAYLALDVLSLILIVLFHARRWVWVFAACVAFTPIIALTWSA